MTTPDDPSTPPQQPPYTPYAPYGQPGQSGQPGQLPPYAQYPQLGYPADQMPGKPMNFGQAVKTCLSKYATFGGRATRPEYWYFFLFDVLVSVVAGFIDGSGGGQTAQLIVGLFFLLPGLAAGARRLHDTDKSGWWQLIGVIPIVGWIVLIVFFCTAGTVAPNRYGPPPA